MSYQPKVSKLSVIQGLFKKNIMAYQKAHIKDEEIPVVLYLIESLLENYFEKNYKYVETSEIKEFISQADFANNKAKPISITTVKDIMEIADFDSGYRPKYTSIEFLICGFLKSNVSFGRYAKENQKDIETSFNRSNYKIQSKNPEAKEKSISSSLIEVTLNDYKLTLNKQEGVIDNLFKLTNLLIGKFEGVDYKSNEVSPIRYKNERITQRWMLKENRRQKNIEKVINKTIEFAKKKTKTKKQIDIDWAAEFFDIIQDCSNERMQFIWAKLLAGELESPGEFSRRTLQRIKVMSQHEALIFDYMSKCLWYFKDEYNGNQWVLILDDSHYADHYFDETFEFDGSDINNLQNLGLLTLSYIELTKDEHYELSFFGKEHIIGARASSYEFSFAALTPSGEEIMSLIDANPNKEYYNKTLDFFRNRKILIS